MENPESNMGQGAPLRDYPVLDAVCMELKNILRAFEPAPEVTQHFRNARIEVLKGMRQIIDNRIAHLSRHAEQGRNITVE